MKPSNLDNVYNLTNVYTSPHWKTEFFSVFSTLHEFLQSMLMQVFAEQIITEIVLTMLVCVAVDPLSDIAN